MIRYITASIFILSIILSQNNTPSVAVLDFEAKGIPKYEAETLTERLRTEIANTKAFRITDRKLLDKIINEQALQQSGCTTDECAAEVGQLLGAQYMISGSIGKLGSTYTIDIKLVSVTTGSAERAKSISFKGPIAGLIIEMEILAWEIGGLTPPQALLAQRKSGADSDRRVTVAVLDFEPRGISQLESQTLTDRFSTEISKTGSAILVTRNVVNEVMQEQGYTAAECSSEECAAEVGALLGVKFMISGAIGKLGQTYTIDAKMFEVATGAAEKTINATYSGPVDGLITEIEILAWEIMGLDPPGKLLSKRKGGDVAQSTGPKSKTRFGAITRSMILPGWGQFYSGRSLMGWAFLGSEAAVGALAYLSYSTYQTHYDSFDQSYLQYSQSPNPLEKQTFKAEAQSNHQSMVDANDQMTLMLYAAAGIYVANIVHAAMFDPQNDIVSKKSSVNLVYDPFLQQPQLRFTIALD